MTRIHHNAPIAAVLWALAWLLLSGSAHAETTDQAALSLARSYFSDLDNQRFDAARAVMSDALRFEDPTYDIAVDDPDAVIEAYANTSAFSNVIIRERMAFASRGTAVIHYVVSLDHSATGGIRLDETGSCAC